MSRDHVLSTRISALSLVGVSLTAAIAHAQTPEPRRLSLTTGAAIIAQTDDETNLGRGVLLAVGASTMVSDGVRIEGEVSIGRHTRGGPNAGYLQATGTPVVGTARAAWVIGPSSWGARPFLSLGPMLTRSRGEFRTSTLIVGPHGHPIDGPVATQPWRVTAPGWELGTGTEMGHGSKRIWRPELRVSGTRAPRSYQPGVDVLEQPILTLRAGLTVIW